jgi:ABC-type cobalamin/Fe3+-siderophores transport system ATPase subunit
MTGAEIKPIIELFILAEKQGWLDKIQVAFKHKHKVLVLGSTGVGKTNFIKSLSEALPMAIELIDRTEFAQHHKLVLDKEPFIFIDTPGQINHQAKRLDVIKQAMAGSISGIINVVSYGYHEYRIGTKDALETDDSIREAFLARHRQIELDALNEWTTLLGDRKTADWLLTVVSKADLWWSSRDDVLKHYESEDYFQALGAATTLHPSFINFMVREHYPENLMMMTVYT